MTDRARTVGVWHTVTEEDRVEGRRILAELLDSLDPQGKGYLSIVRADTVADADSIERKGGQS